MTASPRFSQRRLQRSPLRDLARRADSVRLLRERLPALAPVDGTADKFRARDAVFHGSELQGGD